MNLFAGGSSIPPASSVVRERSFASCPRKRAYGMQLIAYSRKSSVGVATLSSTPRAIGSDSDEIRFTLHE